MTQEAGTLIFIRDQRDALTPAGRRIADYVLHHPEKVVYMSIRELAQAGNTSDAAVIRFCKAVGVRGYREFIVGLSTALGAQDETDRFSDIRLGDSLSAIIHNISYSNRQSIEDTLKVLDEKEVGNAAKFLLKAQRIAFYGVGASSLVAMDAQQKFARIGYFCHAYTNSHDQITSAVLLKDWDVAVVISDSGETREIVETLAALQGTHSRVIAITRRRESTLGRKADVVLHFSTPEITFRSGAMGSRIAMLNVIDVLYASVASQGYNEIHKNLERTREALSGRTPITNDTMNS